MRNLARINNYAKRIAAHEAWSRFALECDRYGLGHIAKSLWPNLSAGWRKTDKALGSLKRYSLHFRQCPNCEYPAYSADLSEIVDAEGCSACDHCGFIQYPIEREGA